MAKLTDINGVGPTRAERLEEAGYDSIDAIATADNTAIAEQADVPEDTALEFVVQAQNMLDEEAQSEDESDEGEPETITIDDPDELVEDDDSDEEESDGPEAGDWVRFSYDFDDSLEYDTFFKAIQLRREKLRRTNRADTEIFETVLDALRNTTPSEGVSFKVEEANDLNDIHTAILQQRTEYQGNNLIDHMDALQKVQDYLDSLREEHLF